MSAPRAEEDNPGIERGAGFELANAEDEDEMLSEGAVREVGPSGYKRNVSVDTGKVEGETDVS